ncbi:MAG: SpoIID/LytB domain-containing protein [Gemmatimonadota bacterium]|nr:SpoIID/LytB domain-containing protein [Gemmatimonadota bacterium]
MGTTADSRCRPWASPAVLLAGALAGCTSASVPARPTAVPSPSSREAEVRIGLSVGTASASVGGGGAVAVNEPDGSRIAVVPGGERWQVTVSGAGLVVTSPSGWVSPRLEAISLAAIDPRAPLWVDGKAYRGVGEVLRDRTGLTIVNRLGMESYLLGVVSAEMGHRSSAEQAALQAQAIVSRTYALRNLRRWRALGFDLYGTVSDQAYGGVAAETAEGRAAVAETRGQVLTYDGAVIEAFYFSTCGGRTAEGFEVFRGAVRPYLRSVSDVNERGSAYCSISPRYRWREEWSGEALRATLQRNLPPVPGTVSPSIVTVTDLRVTQRSSSGRVDQVSIGLGATEVKVDGHTRIRQLLRLPSGQLLRSTAFSLSTTGAGRAVTRLVIDGAGAGHGVGLCQWGAVGRARAGQGYQQILAAYFPGTRLERRY